MKLDFYDKVLNIMFSMSFSLFFIHELSKFLKGFTFNVIFVIMFVFIAKYVYKIVRSELVE